MQSLIRTSIIILIIMFSQIFWALPEGRASTNVDDQLSKIFEDTKNEFFSEINELFKNHFRKSELCAEDTIKIVDAQNQIPYLFERLINIGYQKHEPKFSQLIKQGDEESMKKFREKFTALAKDYAARFIGSLFIKSDSYDFSMAIPNSKGKSSLELVLQNIGFNAKNEIPDIPEDQWFTNSIESDFFTQWCIDAVKARECQKIAKGNGVLVSVLDTGIDPNNSVFKDKLVPGYSFTQRTTPPWTNEQVQPIDWGGHGTLTAATVLLIAPECRIMPVKFLDGSMFNPAMDYWIYELEAAGIYYAVHHGAHIIQIGGALMSSNPVVADAVRYAYYHNVVICTSAGNISRPHNGFKFEKALYRSFDNELLLIGGAGMEDNKMRLTLFTVPNFFMDVAAPAEHVFLILPSYMEAKNMYGDGTSMASPIVSGIVALMRSAAPPSKKLLQQPTAYCRLVSKCLHKTARLDILGLVEPNDVVGQGLVDANAAVKMIQQELGIKK